MGTRVIVTVILPEGQHNTPPGYFTARCPRHNTQTTALTGDHCCRTDRLACQAVVTAPTLPARGPVARVDLVQLVILPLALPLRPHGSRCTIAQNTRASLQSSHAVLAGLRFQTPVSSPGNSLFWGSWTMLTCTVTTVRQICAGHLAFPHLGPRATKISQTWD